MKKEEKQHIKCEKEVWDWSKQIQFEYKSKSLSGKSEGKPTVETFIF